MLHTATRVLARQGRPRGGASVGPVPERGLCRQPPWPSGSGDGLLIRSTQVRILPGAPLGVPNSTNKIVTFPRQWRRSRSPYTNRVLDSAEVVVVLVELIVGLQQFLSRRWRMSSQSRPLEARDLRRVVQRTVPDPATAGRVSLRTDRRETTTATYPGERDRSRRIPPFVWNALMPSRWSWSNCESSSTVIVSGQAS